MDLNSYAFPHTTQAVSIVRQATKPLLKELCRMGPVARETDFAYPLYSVEEVATFNLSWHHYLNTSRWKVINGSFRG